MVMAVGLVGCAVPADPGPSAIIPAPSSGMTSTERLAYDLIEADSAFAADDRELLAEHVRAIELAGARPSDARGEAALRAWRGALPPEQRPMRGRVLGPAYISGRLAPGGKLRTEQVMLGGKPVSVAAGTAPRNGLRLRIARGDGNLVCEQSPAHARECRFVPTYTQRYRIELHNSGKRDARYHIVFD
jgi:hypothetical protein|tara:strand:- start:4845 stop:5408 length:564 start_codon:yes stop_codon:yes gene_type:complete